MIQEKTENQGASNENDTSERGVVHDARIAAVVSTKSWASVASSDDDDELLPSLGSTSFAMREC